MIQIIPGDRTGADNLAEIVDPIRNTVMAAGPDAEINRDSIAPKNRVRVNIRRARVSGDIARIVHCSPGGGEKAGRHWQLFNHWHAVVIRDIVIPYHRKDIALACNAPGVVDRICLAYDLPVQRTQLNKIAIPPKKSMHRRAKNVADHMAEIIYPVGISQSAEIRGPGVLVWPKDRVAGKTFILTRPYDLAQVIDAMGHNMDRPKLRIDVGERRQSKRITRRIPINPPKKASRTDHFCSGHFAVVVEMLGNRGRSGIEVVRETHNGSGICVPKWPLQLKITVGCETDNYRLAVNCQASGCSSTGKQPQISDDNLWWACTIFCRSSRLGICH